MSKLKPSEQELIHKLYLDKQPMMQAEYAKINKTSVGSIKMQVQRVKAKLKKLL